MLTERFMRNIREVMTEKGVKFSEDNKVISGECPDAKDIASELNCKIGDCREAMEVYFPKASREAGMSLTNILAQFTQDAIAKKENKPANCLRITVLLDAFVNYVTKLPKTGEKRERVGTVAVKTANSAAIKTFPEAVVNPFGETPKYLLSTLLLISDTPELTKEYKVIEISEDGSEKVLDTVNVENSEDTTNEESEE